MNLRRLPGNVATAIEVGIIFVLLCVAIAVGKACAWFTGVDEMDGEGW